MNRIAADKRIKIKYEKMLSVEYIKKTQEYLFYLEQHLYNIQKAWDLVQEKCEDIDLIWDDYKWHYVNNEIRNHDISKFSPKEFTYYRATFYPTKDEVKLIGDAKLKENFHPAFEHHLENNSHHWQTIKKKWNSDNKYKNNWVQWGADVIHLVVDWLAMSFEFDSDIKDYYKSQKEKMNFPDEVANFLEDIIFRF